MKVKLPTKTWTAINTNPDEYLIQNTSEYDVRLVVSDTEPVSTAYDFELKPNDGISDKHVIGTIWGRPAGSVDVFVGLVEG